jgi:hypothetical protein
MSVSADLRASGAGEVLLSHVSARAVEAVCLLMIDSLDLKMLMKVIPSVSTTVLFAIRARMNEAGWLSVLKAAGSKLRPRMPTFATTSPLPVRFRAKTTVMAIAASFISRALQDAQSPMDAMIGGDEGILEPDDLARCSILLIFEKSEPATARCRSPEYG